MPSSFTAKRNYAHCPLKKRPLSLYNEPAIPEQEEPEDLSVKRPRIWSPPPEKTANYFNFQESINKVENTVAAPLRSPCISTTSGFSAHQERIPVGYVEPYKYTPFQNLHQHFHLNSVDSTTVKTTSLNNESISYSVKSAPAQKSEENFPSLAEYYLQLFKSTSEAEAKKKEHSQPPTSSTWHTSSYLPPSPQNSPTESTIKSQSPALFPHRAMTVSGPCYIPPMHTYPETSALISPISTCSSTTSESEDDGIVKPFQTGSKQTVRYSCESCGKSYFTQSGLRKHNELHCSSLGPRAFTCKHCTKAYTTIGALKMHIRTHTLPCKCHVCGKAFSRPWLLQGHIRTHTGEKPFECQQCHRSFADRSNLRAHQQTHERVKRYACQTCKKTFSRMSLLNKHAESSCMGVRIPQNSPILSI